MSSRQRPPGRRAVKTNAARHGHSTPQQKNGASAFSADAPFLRKLLSASSRGPGEEEGARPPFFIGASASHGEGPAFLSWGSSLVPAPVGVAVQVGPAPGRTAGAGPSYSRTSCRLLVSDTPYHDVGPIARAEHRVIKQFTVFASSPVGPGDEKLDQMI